MWDLHFGSEGEESLDDEGVGRCDAVRDEGLGPCGAKGCEGVVDSLDFRAAAISDRCAAPRGLLHGIKRSGKLLKQCSTKYLLDPDHESRLVVKSIA